MKLYETTVTFTATGLVLARSKKEALGIIYAAMQRLIEERDDATVELSDVIDGDYDGDYLLLNGDLSYDEAKTVISKQYLQEVA